MAIANRSEAFGSILAELKSQLDELMQEAQRLAQANVTTAEEAQKLQELAASGELGAEFKQAADLVASGAETWDALFSGKSANSSLLIPAMTANSGKYGAELSAQIRSDPEPDMVE